MENKGDNIGCYLIRSKDVASRYRSTSGGVFYELASCAIREYNAKVYGAAFESDFSVTHICVTRIEELAQLQGSKYPQSKIVHLYKKIKAELDNGEYVVFSGTPCQVNALKKYLVVDYKTLLCVDLICYGVAAPKVWGEYLKTYHPQGIKQIRFKDKENGWKNWYTVLEYEKSRISLQGLTNLFMSGYMNGTYIRPSCTSCKFKGNNRLSDITIGDAWGKGESSTLNDNKGLSIAVVHSERGALWLKSIGDNVDSEGVDFSEYIQGNPYYSIAPDLDMVRNMAFYADLESKGFKYAYEKHCVPHGLRRLKYLYKLKRRERTCR